MSTDDISDLFNDYRHNPIEYREQHDKRGRVKRFLTILPQNIPAGVELMKRFKVYTKKPYETEFRLLRSDILHKRTTTVKGQPVVAYELEIPFEVGDPNVSYRLYFDTIRIKGNHPRFFEYPIDRNLQAKYDEYKQKDKKSLIDVIKRFRPNTHLIEEDELSLMQQRAEQRRIAEEEYERQREEERRKKKAEDQKKEFERLQADWENQKRKAEERKMQAVDEEIRKNILEQLNQQEQPQEEPQQEEPQQEEPQEQEEDLLGIADYVEVARKRFQEQEEAHQELEEPRLPTPPSIYTIEERTKLLTGVDVSKLTSAEIKQLRATLSKSLDSDISNWLIEQQLIRVLEEENVQTEFVQDAARSQYPADEAPQQVHVADEAPQEAESVRVPTPPSLFYTLEERARLLTGVDVTQLPSAEIDRVLTRFRNLPHDVTDWIINQLSERLLQERREEEAQQRQQQIRDGENFEEEVEISIDSDDAVQEVELSSDSESESEESNEEESNEEESEEEEEVRIVRYNHEDEPVEVIRGNDEEERRLQRHFFRRFLERAQQIYNNYRQYIAISPQLRQALLRQLEQLAIVRAREERANALVLRRPDRPDNLFARLRLLEDPHYQQDVGIVQPRQPPNNIQPLHLVREMPLIIPQLFNLFRRRAPEPEEEEEEEESEIELDFESESDSEIEKDCWYYLQGPHNHKPSLYKRNRDLYRRPHTYYFDSDSDSESVLPKPKRRLPIVAKPKPQPKQKQRR